MLEDVEAKAADDNMMVVQQLQDKHAAATTATSTATTATVTATDDPDAIHVDKSTYEMRPQGITVGFKHLSITSLHPPKHLLTNVTGFVPKGGITAVLGPSASGKSVLMKFLCGRLPSLQHTGEITLLGRPIRPTRPENNFGFVPQEDVLVGDLTVRETFQVAAELRKRKSKAECVKDVSMIINKLGLDGVSDNVIGTVVKRGLSGGQKRRVMVGQELICDSAALFLDEPTSGLDGTTAFEVVETIRSFTKASEGKFSVMMSIHQPSIRVVNCFDYLLFLGQGGNVFFGTLPEAIYHFAVINRPVPNGLNPTDYIISETDDSFREEGDRRSDFPQLYATSQLAAHVVNLLDSSVEASTNRLLSGGSASGKSGAAGIGSSLSSFLRMGKKAAAGKEEEEDAEDGLLVGDDFSYLKMTSFTRQVTTLMRRDMVIALRDPTLYYLQLFLHLGYGFLIGAVFWKAPHMMDATLIYLPSSVIWLLMLNSYVHIFKIFYLMKSNKRFYHEHANNSYTPQAYYVAETVVTLLSMTIYIPGQAMGYFMIALPPEQFGFHVLLTFVMGVTAESLTNWVTKFTHNVAYAIVAAQAMLVIWTTFAGGVFIGLDDVPDYWRWLMELGLFTQGSRSGLLNVCRKVTYNCPTSSIFADDSSATGFSCDATSWIFPCDAYDVSSGTAVCTTDGLTVLEQISGGIHGSKWRYLGYLALLGVSFRICAFILYHHPWDNIVQWIDRKLTARAQDMTVLELEQDLKRVQGEVSMLRNKLGAFLKDGAARLTGPPGGGYAPMTKREAGPPSAAIDDDDEEGKMEQPLEVEAEESESDGNGVMLDKAVATARAAAEAAAKAKDREALRRRQTSFNETESHNALKQPVLTWRNIVVTLPKSGKVLIDHISGYAEAGCTLALMGPSGAGKTTLLNALSRRAVYAKVEGSVLLGDKPMTKFDLDLVPQFDELNTHMTVRELFTYMSYLKVKSNRRRHSGIVELMRILGLGEKADKNTGELSGGEKKRVSIGMGLVSNPAVLFLDEPTTGLDSAAAYSVVRYITKVAKQTGVVCIMTIHQPSGQVFNRLGNLMLLELGRLAYFGSRPNATHFFTSVTGHPLPPLANPADVYMDLISAPPPGPKNGGKSWKEVHQQSDYVMPIPEETPTAHDGTMTNAHEPPSGVLKFDILVKNTIIYYLRDPSVHWIRLAELIVVAFFIGTMYFDLTESTVTLNQLSGAVFFNVWCVLFAVISATPTFVVNRRTALDEMLNGAYGTSVSCASHFVASVPFTVVSAIIYQSMFYWLVDFRTDTQTFVYFIVMTTLLLFFMEALMLVVVQALKNDMLSCTFSMVVFGQLFLLPGFFVQTDDMPSAIRWASYIVPTRYAFNGMMYSVLHGRTYGDESGDDILQDFFGQSGDESDWSNVGIVILFVVGMRVSHWLMVWWSLKPYQKELGPLPSGAGSAIAEKRHTSKWAEVVANV